MNGKPPVLEGGRRRRRRWRCEVEVTDDSCLQDSWRLESAGRVSYKIFRCWYPGWINSSVEMDEEECQCTH